MNDSDTEFAEDESVISTNIIRKEEIGNQSNSVWVPEESIHIFLPKTRMNPILEVRMNGILLLSLNILPISHLLLLLNVLPISHLLLPLNVLSVSHLLLPLNVLPISHLLLPLNVLPITHLLLLLRNILPISHPNLLGLLQLLYLKTPRNGSKARWLKTKQTKKKQQVNAPSDENSTN